VSFHRRLAPQTLLYPYRIPPPNSQKFPGREETDFPTGQAFLTRTFHRRVRLSREFFPVSFVGASLSSPSDKSHLSCAISPSAPAKWLFRNRSSFRLCFYLCPGLHVPSIFLFSTPPPNRPASPASNPFSRSSQASNSTAG